MPATATPQATAGRPVDRDEARRLLTSGLPACPRCQPDIELRILG
ncbi:DUF6233 domain-containing protein [Streptomyces sp. NPDC056948]